MPEGYCVKERKKVEIKDPQQVTLRGEAVTAGRCTGGAKRMGE